MKKLKYFLELMRPKQWFKSFYMVFGTVPAIILFRPDWFLITKLLFLGVLDLIMIQGIIYGINDITDVENDKKHPVKKLRPLPSGKLTIKEVIYFVIFLFVLSSILSLYLDKRVFLINILLILVNILYSVWPRLKDVVLIDVLTVGLNFPLRVLVGWFLFDPGKVFPSKSSIFITFENFKNTENIIQKLIFSTQPGILNIYIKINTITISFISMMIFTYSLAVYLSTLKRLREKIEGLEKSRKVLYSYSQDVLKIIAISSGLVAFISSIFLILTMKLSLLLLEPIFLYALIRYYFLTFEDKSIVGKPEEILFFKEFQILFIISLFIGLAAIFYL